MHEEMERERDFISTRELKTIYFGGGTPSTLSIEEVEGFLRHISSIFRVDKDAEITLEANPDDLSRSYLEALRRVGVNRLSIGIQSFDDAELHFMNRRHSAAQAREAVAQAREAGFENIAIDLIFGVDGFGGEILERSIAQAVELDVEHIAAYHLTIEPRTKFGVMLSKGELRQVDESVSEQEFLLVQERLTAAGYEHYEISAYAKRGFRSRHNSAYWEGKEYLGIGAGAHSYNGQVRRWAQSSVAHYIRGVEYEHEELSFEDRLNETIMTSLRREEGILLSSFGAEFGRRAKDDLLERARPFLESEDLVLYEDKLTIPKANFLRSDMIIAHLFSE